MPVQPRLGVAQNPRWRSMISEYCLAAAEKVDNQLITKYIQITPVFSTHEIWHHLKLQQDCSIRDKLHYFSYNQI